jgi:predicted transport protein
MTYKFYDNDIFHLGPLQIVSERQTDPVAVSGNIANQEVGPAAYSVEAHRSRGSAEIQAVFDDLRSRILALGPQVVERAVQAYIGYRLQKNFAEVHILKSSIRIELRAIEYDDPRGRVTKLPGTYRYTLDRQILVNSAGDLDYVMSLIEQSYSDVV